jgi:hypothetical protein
MVEGRLGPRGGGEKPGAPEFPGIRAGVSEMVCDCRGKLTICSHLKNKKRFAKAKMRVGERRVGWHCSTLIMKRLMNRPPVHPWSDAGGGYAVAASGVGLYTFVTFPT